MKWILSLGILMLLVLGCTGSSGSKTPAINQTNTTIQSNVTLTNLKDLLNDSYCFARATNFTLGLLPKEQNTTNRELSLTFNTINESEELVKNINLTECSSEKIAEYKNFIDFLKSQ